MDGDPWDYWALMQVMQGGLPCILFETNLCLFLYKDPYYVTIFWGPNYWKGYVHFCEAVNYIDKYFQLCRDRYRMARTFVLPGRFMYIRPLKPKAHVKKQSRKYDAFWAKPEVTCYSVLSKMHAKENLDLMHQLCIYFVKGTILILYSTQFDHYCHLSNELISILGHRLCCDSYMALTWCLLTDCKGWSEPVVLKPHLAYSFASCHTLIWIPQLVLETVYPGEVRSVKDHRTGGAFLGKKMLDSSQRSFLCRGSIETEIRDKFRGTTQVCLISIYRRE